MLGSSSVADLKERCGSWAQLVALLVPLGLECGGVLRHALHGAFLVRVGPPEGRTFVLGICPDGFPVLTGEQRLIRAAMRVHLVLVRSADLDLIRSWFGRRGLSPASRHPDREKHRSTEPFRDQANSHVSNIISPGEQRAQPAEIRKNLGATYTHRQEQTDGRSPLLVVLPPSGMEEDHIQARYSEILMGEKGPSVQVSRPAQSTTAMIT